MNRIKLATVPRLRVRRSRSANEAENRPLRSGGQALGRGLAVKIGAKIAEFGIHCAAKREFPRHHALIFEPFLTADDASDFVERFCRTPAE